MDKRLYPHYSVPSLVDLDLIPCKASCLPDQRCHLDIILPTLRPF